MPVLVIKHKFYFIFDLVLCELSRYIKRNNILLNSSFCGKKKRQSRMSLGYMMSGTCAMHHLSTACVYAECSTDGDFRVVHVCLQKSSLRHPVTGRGAPASAPCSEASTTSRRFLRCGIYPHTRHIGGSFCHSATSSAVHSSGTFAADGAACWSGSPGTGMAVVALTDGLQ